MSSSSQEISTQCRTKRFITLFARAYHLSVSEPDEFNPRPSILFSDCISIFSNACVFKLAVVLRISPPKPCMHFLSPPCVPHAPSAERITVCSHKNKVHNTETKSNTGVQKSQSAFRHGKYSLRVGTPSICGCPACNLLYVA